MNNKVHRKNTGGRIHFVPEARAGLSLKPQLLYAGRLIKNPNWSDESHSHGFCEIMYINSGKGTIAANGSSVTVRSGDIVIYNKGFVHSEKSDLDDPLEMLFLGVTNLRIGELDPDCLIGANDSFVVGCGYYAQAVAQLFEEIVCETENSQPYCTDIAGQLLFVLLYKIFRLLDYARDSLAQNENYLRAKRYLDQNYTTEISLEKLSTQLFMSPSYLSRLFKQNCGMTIMRYITHKRMEKAKTLLLGSSLTVNEIAQASGYTDSAYFCRIFKSTQGTTPSLFRVSAQTKNHTLLSGSKTN